MKFAVPVLLAVVVGQTTADPHVARVDAVFKQYARTDSPGCAVGVYKDGATILTRAYGMANLDHDVPLTPRSVFHVASVSKQFTAAAILLLAQDGRLTLDDPVRKHIPELADFGEPITIRHLLNHTSGLRDQWSLLGLAGWRYSRDQISDEDVMYLMSRQKELNFRPGERHLYSNSGYTLLAIVASRVSGKSFRDFTNERIFKPLGMVNTFFRDNFNDIVKHQAYGYAPAGSTFRLSVTNFDTAGATSLMTTVEDLAKWNGNFENPAVGGAPFLASLLERGVLRDGSRIPYASGIVHGTLRGATMVQHGGADAGYRSAFVRFPDQRLGISVLCNLATTNPSMLANRVAEVYLGDALKPEPPPAADEPEVPMTPEALAKFAGVYWNAAQATVGVLMVENGKLTANQGNDRAPLVPIGPNVFVLRPQRQYFTFDEKGARVGNAPGAGERFERVQKFTPTAAQLGEFAGAYRSEELDITYRIRLDGSTLRLDRLKNRPSTLAPMVSDTFNAPGLGVLRFSRDASGKIDGFRLEAGRVRGLHFTRE